LPGGREGGRIAAMRRPDDLDAVKAALRAMLPELRARYGVSYLGVFGSWARGEQTPTSDLDLLVDFERPPPGWGEIELELELERRLGLDVDLVPRRRLKPFIGARVLREVQPV
jgi:predicted nucleotidyltransferase